ncbi:MAG TPA: hypothetical protein PKM88_07270 [bacterium]|nr:hypothetical protein [bacterium]
MVLLLSGGCRTTATLAPAEHLCAECDPALKDNQAEYEVYSYIINSMLIPELLGTDARGRTVSVIVIGDVTVSPLSVEDLAEEMAQTHHHVDLRTREDFSRKITDTRRVCNQFAVPAGTAEIMPMQKKDQIEMLTAVYARYPGAQGITSFSRVGFNQDKTEALVYVGTTRGFLWGYGGTMLLRKQDGRWRKVQQFVSWIS